MASDTTPPNIAELQFIVLAVTGVARGKKANSQIGIKNNIAAMLIANPNLPSDHRRGGRGTPYSRLQTRLPMVMK